MPVKTKVWRRQRFGGMPTGALGEPSKGNGADPRHWPWIPAGNVLSFPAVNERVAGMKIEALHIGMKVQHPQYGIGLVKTIAEHTAEVEFAEGLRAISPEGSGLKPAEPQVAITGLDRPLELFVAETARAVMEELGVDRPESVAEELGVRWHKGRLVLHPADPALQPKEVPLEVFFHKIVMLRNNLRVLEQKINAHEKLSDAEKVEMQQYISRSYGSMTTFNILFRAKPGQFGGG